MLYYIPICKIYTQSGNFSTFERSFHMPLFSYHCDECNADFELLLARFDSEAECPKCGSEKILRQPSRIGAINAGNSCAMKSSCPAGGCCHGNCAGKH